MVAKEPDRLTSLGMLASGVAHEVNNPLAYISGNLEFSNTQIRAILNALNSSDSKPSWYHQLNEISVALADAQDGAERVRRLTDDLRTFARGDDKGHALLNVNEVMEAALRSISADLAPRGHLVKDLQPVPQVTANEARLEQVFVNLLVNAIQALPDGSHHTGQVTVKTGTDAQRRVVVEIADNGCGIPEKVLPHIFDPFFTTREHGVGLGLGLSICHGVINGLGGALTVSSTRGAGSVFRVVLPATQAVAKREAEAPAPQRGRVLVVDDESMICLTIQRALSKEHDVTTLTESKAALALISQGQRFDVILCDVMMPAMTGMDLYEHLLVVAPDQADQMVFMTGGAFTERAESFLSTVRNPRVDKPFNPVNLRSVVRDLVVARR